MSDIFPIRRRGPEVPVHPGVSNAPEIRWNDDGSFEFFVTGEDYSSHSDLYGIVTHRNSNGDVVGVRIEGAKERAQKWWNDKR